MRTSSAIPQGILSDARGKEVDQISCNPAEETVMSNVMDTTLEESMRQLAARTGSQKVDARVFDVSKTSSKLVCGLRMHTSSGIFRDLVDIPKITHAENAEDRLEFLIGKVAREKRRLERTGQPFPKVFAVTMALGVGKDSEAYAAYPMVVSVKNDKQGEYMEIYKESEKPYKRVHDLPQGTPPTPSQPL